MTATPRPLTGPAASEVDDGTPIVAAPERLAALRMRPDPAGSAIAPLGRLMTATPRPPQAVPQAVPQAAAVDDDERDDGPNPVGVMLIAGFLSLLIFGGGVYVGFTANVDRWYAALKGMGL